ncbi:glycosyltransferase family 9 protein [Candidatus Omnitrophota bacterium]
MKVDLMRKIDYWAGIPICFLLSAIKTTRYKKDLPKKILFLEFSERGSAILAYPAIKRAKELFPEARIFFWIFKRNRDSIDIPNIIPKENVITMRDDTFYVMAKDTLSNLRKIRKEKMDIVIDMELFARFSAILTYLSGARTKVGFYRFCQEGLYRGDLHDVKVQYNPYLHISLNFMALVQSLKTSQKNAPLLKESLDDSEIKLPIIRYKKEKKEEIFQRLTKVKDTLGSNNKLVILNPTSSPLLPIRSWSIKNYRLLTERLLKDVNAFVVMIGLESNNTEKHMISSMVKHERCIDLIGKTSMDELLDLFSIADLLISHDGGPVHFASLTKIDMIVLFGPETPRCYSPLSSNATILYSNFACSPCVSAYNHRHSACSDNKCLQAISVEDVYRASKKHLYK